MFPRKQEKLSFDRDNIYMRTHLLKVAVAAIKNKNEQFNSN